MSGVAPIAVVETPEFLSATRKLMTEEERALLVLAYNPVAGDLIRGTGGVRKLRWGIAGRGKRGARASSISTTAPTSRCSLLRRTPRTSGRI